MINKKQKVWQTPNGPMEYPAAYRVISITSKTGPYRGRRRNPDYNLENVYSGARLELNSVDPGYGLRDVLCQLAFDNKQIVIKRTPDTNWQRRTDTVSWKQLTKDVLPNLSTGQTFTKISSYSNAAQKQANADAAKAKQPEDITLDELLKRTDAQGQPVVTKVKVKKPKLITDPTLKMIHESYKIKPESIFISEIKWKYIVRTIVRGHNIMMRGDAGSGKTQTVIAAAKAMKRPFYRFNLGATQDPKSFLLGNMHFENGKTVFHEADFLKAIQVKDACILLDEMSRAHPDAHNILMTITDLGQGYVRVDDHPDSPVINVAEGVSFLATANCGNEYTGTRPIDRALEDRFTICEMDILSKEEEGMLIKMNNPMLGDRYIDYLTLMTQKIRQEANDPASRISKAISTRMALEMAGLLTDGFTLKEAAEICIYPGYDIDGGTESERTFVIQLVQQWAVDIEDEEEEETISPQDDDLIKKAAEELEDIFGVDMTKAHVQDSPTSKMPFPKN